jgi:hypothetical protein
VEALSERRDKASKRGIHNLINTIMDIPAPEVLQLCINLVRTNAQNKLIYKLNDVSSRPDVTLTALKTVQNVQDERLSKMVVPWFHSLDSRIRYHALDLFFKQRHPKGHGKDVDGLAFRFTSDSDAYVQTLMLQVLASRNFCKKFSLEKYRRFVSLLVHVDKLVRKEALGLVVQMAQQHGSVEIPYTTLILHPNSSSLEQQFADGEKNRLVDDAFLRLCDVVNSDVDFEIRTIACRALGKLQGVSLNVIQQSLSQNFIRVRKRKWNDSDAAPALPCELTTCGAIVQALEEDVPALRLAGLESLSALTLSDAISEQALGILLYCTHDSVPSLRDEALKRILGLVKRGYSLDVEQLSNLLGLLQDSDLACRMSVLDILGNIKLAGEESLAITLTSLHQFISYSTDQSIVFKTIALLGRNNDVLLGKILQTLESGDVSMVFSSNGILSSDAMYSVLIYNAFKVNPDLSLSKAMKKFIRQHAQAFPMHFQAA